MTKEHTWLEIVEVCGPVAVVSIGVAILLVYWAIDIRRLKKENDARIAALGQMLGASTKRLVARIEAARQRDEARRVALEKGGFNVGPPAEPRPTDPPRGQRQ